MERPSGHKPRLFSYAHTPSFIYHLYSYGFQVVLARIHIQAAYSGWKSLLQTWSFQFTLGKQHHLPSYASQNLAVSLHFTTTPFFLCPLTSNILSQFTVTTHPDYSTSFLTLQSLLPSSPSSTLQNTVSSQLFIRHLLLKSLRGFPLWGQKQSPSPWGPSWPSHCQPLQSCLVLPSRSFAGLLSVPQTHHVLSHPRLPVVFHLECFSSACLPSYLWLVL